MREPDRYRGRSRWAGRLAACGAAATILLLVFVVWNPSGQRAAPIRMQKRLVLEIHTVPPSPQPPPPQIPPQQLERKREQTPAPPSPLNEAIAAPPKDAAPPLPAPPGALPSLGASLTDNGLAEAGLGPGGGGNGSGFGGNGGGGGAGGNGYGAFVAAIKEKLQFALANDEITRFGTYRIRLSLRLSDRGQLQACSPIDSSGDANMDRALCRVAERIMNFAPPPEDKRGQPVVVRVGAIGPAG